YLAPHRRPETPDAPSEKRALDEVARGTYVLLQAALKASVRRVVLASRLDLMAAYPASAVGGENWKPRPTPDAVSLAPYVAELALREFVRAEEMQGIC